MTIVSCVEAGVLEPTTIRMVESLRRFGGRFAGLDVVAVTPRTGPPLSAETRRRMRDLGIDHIRAHPRTSYVWHHYMNKAQAVKAAEQLVQTDSLTWVDSDIIFLRQPDDLELPPTIDFLASAPDTGLIGSHGSEDPKDAFWERCARLIGRNVDELPWVTTGDGHRIRFYWNAGLFVYRRSSNFGSEFVIDFEKAMTERVARNHSEVHGMDQVILGLSALRLGLRWKAIPDTSNFPVLSFLPQNFDPTKVGPATVLHYHDSMSVEVWPRLLNTLKDAHPDVHEWLEPLGPVIDPVPARWRVMREALRIKRGINRRLYYATLRSVDSTNAARQP
jgi:hypothetical protein